MSTNTRMLAGAVALSLLFAWGAVAPRAVHGHCDTLDGPVVTEARAALEKGDVTPILRWVAKEDEDEIRRAFRQTLAVRTKGPEARELADRFFFETLVRVHRAAEGAPFTGLKPAGTPIPPVVERADDALESGSVDDLAKRIAQHVEAGIRERFAKAAEAKKHANENVDAGREFVKAYVEYVHYVERLHQDVTGADASHEHGATSGHDH